VIKFVSNLRFSGAVATPIQLTATIFITEILLKLTLNSITHLMQLHVKLSNSQPPPPPFTSSNIQQYQHMGITFHNLYVMLELVPSAVIFWTELSLALLKQGSVAHRLKSLLQTLDTVVTKNWLTWRNVHFSYGNGSFPFYVDFVLSSITDKTYDYMSYTVGVLYQKVTVCPSRTPPVFWSCPCYSSL
jgi:hypothetical protein